MAYTYRVIVIVYYAYGYPIGRSCRSVGRSRREPSDGDSDDDGRRLPLFARGLIVGSVLDLMNFSIAVTYRQCRACDTRVRENGIVRDRPARAKFGPLRRRERVYVQYTRGISYTRRISTY